MPYANFNKGPCIQIVYTLALKYTPFRYIGPKVYTIWVHGPLGIVGPYVVNSVRYNGTLHDTPGIEADYLLKMPADKKDP